MPPQPAAAATNGATERKHATKTAQTNHVDPGFFGTCGLTRGCVLFVETQGVAMLQIEPEKGFDAFDGLPVPFCVRKQPNRGGPFPFLRDFQPSGLLALISMPSPIAAAYSSRAPIHCARISYIHVYLLFSCPKTGPIEATSQNPLLACSKPLTRLSPVQPQETEKTTRAIISEITPRDYLRLQRPLLSAWCLWFRLKNTRTPSTSKFHNNPKS